MPDPSNSDKSLVRRCIASHRLLAVLVLLLLSVGIVAAASPFGVSIGSGGVFEDFEDGDTSNWWNSTEGFYDQPPTSTARAFSGNVSVDVNPNDATYSINFTDPKPIDSYTFHTWTNFTNTDETVQYSLGNYNGDIGELELSQDSRVRVTGHGTTGFQMSNETWYVVRFENIDYSANEFDVAIYDGDTLTEVERETNLGFANAGSEATDITIATETTPGSAVDMYFDTLATNTSEDVFPPEVSGYVLDGDGDPVGNSRVVANQGGTEQANVTTASDGSYSYRVSNGTYNTTASKNGFIDDSATINVAGSTTQNYTLLSVEESLTVDARRFMRHDTSIPYTVTFASDRTASGTLQRRDVTDDDANLSVTSGDVNALTVNNSTNQFESTDNRSVAAIVTVTANYSYDGNSYNTTHNVTVANVTIDNFEILPPWARLQATITPGSTGGSGVGDDDHSFYLIMIATMTAVAGTLLMSVFVGLGGFSMIIMAGWLMGLTDAGLMLVVLTVVGFAGLNMAANIDYAVT